MKKQLLRLINKWEIPVENRIEEVNVNTPVREEIDSWIEILNNTGKELNRLVISGESEFLSLGDLLKDLSSQATDISHRSVDAAKMLAGKEVEEAIANLEEMLSGISLYLQKSGKELEANIATLHSVIKIASEIDNSDQGFGKIVRMMRMLGVTIRIENAQFKTNRTNFSNLSNQVLELSEEIGRKSKGIYDGIRNLKCFGFNHLSRIKAHHEKRGEQTDLIIQNMQGCLDTLKVKYNSSSDTATSVSTGSREIANQINQIVMSMQFHDICRQRIEHVCQALSNQVEKLTRFSNDDRSSLIQITETCELQVLQLEETELTMRNAVSRMVDSLTEIFNQTSDIGQMINRMVLGAGSDQKCSFRQMETGIDHVEKLLKSNLNLGGEIDTAIGEIVQKVREVEAFVSDIHHIGSEIDLIAVNGIISTAHMGEEGASLGVLADAVQKLSINAREQIREVSTVLQEMGASTKYLRRDNMEKDDDGIENQVDDMVGNLEELVESLKNVGALVRTKLNQVEKTSQPFVKAVEDNISQIQIHIQFKEVVSKHIGQIQSVIDSMRTYRPNDFFTSPAELHQTIAQNYTMREERQVHETFMKGQEESGAPPDGKIGESDFVVEEEWGSNIELF